MSREEYVLMKDYERKCKKVYRKVRREMYIEAGVYPAKKRTTSRRKNHGNRKQH
jgi:hypothetical protein